MTEADLRAPTNTAAAPAKPRPQKLPPYMHRRGTVLYFKRKIPADVAHAFPDFKGQVWRSLGTDNLERAKLQLAVEVSAFDIAVANARSRTASQSLRAMAPKNAETSKYLLPAHIPALIARWDYHVTKTYDGLRAMGPSPNRSEMREAFDAEIELCCDLAANDDLDVIEPLAQEILKEERLIAPPGSDVRKQLQRGLLQALITNAETNKQRYTGRVTPLPPKPPAAARNLPTLQLRFEDWKKKQTRPRTIAAMKKAVLDFHALHDALPIEAITRQHAREYRDDLFGKSLASETIRNRLSFLATLVRHGHQEIIEDLRPAGNPFDDIEVREGAQSVRVRKERRAYTVTELTTLFQSRLYREGYRPSGQPAESSYWAPLLGPFTGARIEEIAQLRIEDIECVNGTWCLAKTSSDLNFDEVTGAVRTK